MSDSVIPAQSGLVTVSIMVNGQILSGEYQVLSIFINKEVNKISSAKITVLDGGFTGLKEDFHAGNSSLFDPGNKVEIKLGYHSKETSVYKGIIIKQGLKMSSDSCKLTIECKEESIKMTAIRNNKIYIDKKDSDIISELAKNSSLSVTVEATDVELPEVVQYYCTDWDFMLSRADLYGLIVITDGDKLKVKKPDLSAAPVVEVENGMSIYSVNLEMDARNQFSKVSSVAWDMKNQKIIKSNSKPVDDIQLGETTSKLSQVLGASEYHLQSASNLPNNLIEAWATGKLSRSKLSKIQGTLKFTGNAKVKPGVMITIKGLSKSFNGDAFVSGVEHIVEDGEWMTEVKLGIPFKSYTEEMIDIQVPSASGMIPGIKGLQTAIVKKIHEDKDGQHRIQIAYPTIEQDNLGVWARLATFYASNECGAFFIPEVGDEVIIGFINEDPQHPIILGSVYSSKNVPGYTSEEKNKIKALVTKSKMKISFDEEKKIITFETPGKNIIVMDDDQKSITLTDMNDNKVEMTKDGMTFTCAKDFIVKAKGKINLEAQQDVIVKATGDFKGEGMNVAMKGNTKFAAEGAQAEVKGSAQTTIKGGIVMIN